MDPDLPEPLLQRAVVLVAAVLPDVPRLPPELARVAAFVPSRRAKAGGRVLARSLVADADLRSRAATQLTLRGPDPQDGLDTAVLAWLGSEPGWEALAEAARADLEDRSRARRELDGEVERVRARAEQAEEALREARTRHRAALEEIKAENATLRRRLGESRTTERVAREAAAQVAAAAEADRAREASRATSQDKELRQLRARLVERDDDLAAGRRTARAEREEVTLRARLLLDTVLDAASGLRRELALPVGDGSPAERLERGLEERSAERAARGGAPAPSPLAHRGPAVRSSHLLDQHLALPRARLLVDGYNVSKTAWASQSLEAQRIRLLGALAPLVARTGAETTVVFDAGAVSERSVAAAPRGVRVIFSPEGVIADDVIRDLVAIEPGGRVVLVVTADQALAADVSRAGARIAAPSALLELLARG